MRFYETLQLGPKRRIVGGGYLLCEDVPIARVGTLTYAAGEVPVTPTADGIVMIERRPEDVFDEDAIRSFEGMPLVDDHPIEGDEIVAVGPDNWRDHALGIMLNVRRGSGKGPDDDSDFLYADVLAQAKSAIDAINAGKRAVSAGYDADYDELSPGRGRQLNIRGNHLALVDRGRCGPRCSIGDSAARSNGKGRSMSVRVQKVTGDARRQLARVRDAIAAIGKKVRTGDSEGVLDEVDKVQDMLGDVISGDAAMDPADRDAGGGSGGTPHHVTINVGGKEPGRPGVGGELGDRVPTVGDDDPAGEGGGQMSEVLERLANLEEAVVAIAEKLGGDGDDESGEDPSAEMGGDAEPEMEDRVPEEREDGTRDPKNVAADRRRGMGDGGRRARVGDSTSMSSEFTEMLARAEILAPGCPMATFDAARPARVTADAMCTFRRNILRRAYGLDDAKSAIDEMLAGAKPAFHDAAAMPCATVSAVYNGAASLVKRARAGDAARTGGARAAVNGFSQKPVTAADLSKRLREGNQKGEFWYGQKQS